MVEPPSARACRSDMRRAALGLVMWIGCGGTTPRPSEPIEPIADRPIATDEATATSADGDLTAPPPPAATAAKLRMLRELIASTEGTEQLEIRAHVLELLTGSDDAAVRAEAVTEGAALVAAPGFAQLAVADRVLATFADALSAARRPAEATAVWRRLIKDYPQSRWVAAAYVALGDAAFEDRDLVAARAMYDRALTDPMVGAYARYKRGWTSFNLGATADALSDFLIVVRTAREPLRKSARADVVRAYAEVGDPAKAVAFFRGIDATDAGTMVLRLGDLYLDQGKLREAVAVYAAAAPLVDAAGGCHALVGTARAAWWQADRAGAEAALTAVVNRGPDPACAANAVELAIAVAEALAADARRTRSGLDPALAAWQRARALVGAGPQRRDVAERTARLAAERAAAIGTGAAWADAADAAADAHAVAADDAATLRWGREALDAWQRAVTLDPTLAPRAEAGRAQLAP